MELYEFFETVGKVRDVRLISDRNSRKSKGFGYIEYFSADSVIPALHLSGTQFMGQTVMVQATQAEKNKTALPAPNTPSSAGPSRIYVGSLHVEVTEDDLISIFRPFGPIKFVNIHMDEKTKRSKGFGFVQYDDPEDAKKALQYANGLELAGKTLNVGLVNENTPSSGTGNVGELDDEPGGLSLNAHSRVMLMAKLQRGTMGVPGMPGGTAIPGVAASGILGGLAPSVSTGVPMPSLVPLNPMLSSMSQVKLPEAPSCCFQLKNMFDPAREDDPDFHLDIKEDVEEECVKHGSVVHISVHKDNPQGLVYVKMDSTESAKKVIAALNHRWFAGKMITADYITEGAYKTINKI